MSQKPPDPTNPSTLDVLLQKARNLQQSGRSAEAIQVYLQALASQPDNLDACYALGILYETQNQAQIAINYYFQALAIRYDFVPAHCALGILFHKLGNIAQAVGCYRQALSLNPDLAETQFNLGCAYQMQGRLDKAIEHYHQAIACKPDFVNAYANLGVAYKSLEQLDKATEQYQKALEIDPHCLQALCNLGLVEESRSHLTEAESYFRRALAIQSDYTEGVAGCALVLEKRGDYKGAYELLRPLVASEERAIGAITNFATVCIRLNKSAEAVPYLQNILKRSDLSADEYVLLLFKLANLHESLHQYESAFSIYQRANTLNAFPFEPTYWIEDIDSLISTFHTQGLPQFSRSTNASEVPVFIIGMPRSGTSLVEQILASHPEIFGSGELADMFECAANLPMGKYPSNCTSLTSEALDQISQRYLERLQKRSPEALRITDKLPLNYLHLGLIAMLFPKARIIHCRRDPLDTCISCYFQNFGTRLTFSNNLEHLGIAYKHYERLMAHWQTVLDLPIFEIHYEELIAEPEAVSRALVDFCGLDWDERCLRFYETNRFINTASYDQVRQPIYDRSVGRSRHYEKHLQVLKNALRGV
jgi:tetratricopeptide (TPR) repeat protein